MTLTGMPFEQAVMSLKRGHKIARRSDKEHSRGRGRCFGIPDDEKDSRVMEFSIATHQMMGEHKFGYADVFAEDWEIIR